MQLKHRSLCTLVLDWSGQLHFPAVLFPVPIRPQPVKTRMCRQKYFSPLGNKIRPLNKSLYRQSYHPAGLVFIVLPIITFIVIIGISINADRSHPHVFSKLYKMYMTVKHTYLITNYTHSNL